MDTLQKLIPLYAQMVVAEKPTYGLTSIGYPGMTQAVPQVTEIRQKLGERILEALDPSKLVAASKLPSLETLSEILESLGRE